MRAAIRCSVLALLLCASRVYADACGPLQFTQEVIMGDATTQLCPRPVDSTLELLHAKLERGAAKNTAVFFEVLRDLRDHYQSQTSNWRAALAEDIDEVLAQAKAGQHPIASFAAVRGAQADLDPESCLFLSGNACYIIKGSPQPTAAGMRVYELTGFDDAYLAQRSLAIAYSALVKLDLPSLDIAIKRLQLAEQRWENLRKRGYLQYPWELALSSVFTSYQDYQACFAFDVYCTGEQGLDPERTRLIALHPGVGMSFSGFGWQKHTKPSADAALALSLELVGVTLYADNFKNYIGASLGAVVNDGDFRDVRPGVFVHVTRWLHVGYLLSVFRNSIRYDGTLFLSSDLGSAFGATFLE